MEIIEIRSNKRYMTLFAIGLVIALLGMNYLAFFGHYYEDNYKYPLVWKLVTIALSLNVIYAIRKLFLRIKRNKPYIIITSTDFSFDYKGVLVSYNWSDISRWEITRPETNSYLTIVALGNTQTIDISLLDKKPQQIGELIQQYKEFAATRQL